MKLAHSYSAIKLYENCPLRYYRQRVVKDVVDQGGEASKHGERIHEFLEKRLAENTQLPQEAERYEPLCVSVEKIAKSGTLYVEKELVLTDELKPTGWWDADAWLRSKLDVLVVVGDTAVVMDWKTGKRRISFRCNCLRRRYSSTTRRCRWLRPVWCGSRPWRWTLRYTAV
jgi:hypothetical protein